MDIKVLNLNKCFNGQQVLKNVSMTFKSGSITCIMGASGIGKTTLANIMMGLQRADSGKIEGLKGKKISAVFQEDRLIEQWDAVKNIMLVCRKEFTQEYIHKNLNEIGLSDYEKKPVSSLSGGMRRRVAIVRALLLDYDVLIMDEPFKGLDYDLKKQVIGYVEKMTEGKTVIIITHDKDEVKMLKADLVIMNAEGSKADGKMQ
ncbi:MAG TPA: ATP-binding cassette domain-containing protein [Mobilitalea sp.]|nr:ATP-binding cassette domain-containing protein [Mobilitalea sp.]